MKLLFLTLLVSYHYFFVAGIPKASSVTVEIKNGTVQGEWRDSADPQRIFAAFINIPYAKPPVGDLRFKPPEPAGKWTGKVGGPKPQPDSYCPQLQEPYFIDYATGTEDCLHLNVYSPRPESNASLPVLVYIHGGGFLKGNGLQHDPKYIMDHDVVVVTFNYRLGALGFLSTGDRVASGNFGLKDQVMALRWVQENITPFGGDPGSVTIAGSDAGAASVHYHYLSDMSRGLFARGIAMGASAFSPWAYSTKPYQKAKNLTAAFYNCSTKTSEKIVDCLKNKTVTELTYAQLIVYDWPVYQYSLFAPTAELKTDGAFLTQHPYEATRSGAMYDAPLLASVTRDEGLLPESRYLYLSSTMGSGWYWQYDWPIFEEDWDTMNPRIFYYNDTLPVDQWSNVSEEIKKRYSIKTYKDFIKAVGDRLYVSSVGKMVELHAAQSSNPVHLYKYSFQEKISNRDDIGVHHGDDLLHIFPVDFFLRDSEQDIAMSKSLAKMVYRFCKGETLQFSDEDPHWPSVSPDEPLSYLEILSPTSAVVKTESDFGQKSFWDSLGFNEDQNFKKELI